LRDQPIRATRITHAFSIGDDDDEILLTVAEVRTPGALTHWHLPLAILWEDQPSTPLANTLAVARVRRGRRVGLLTDAVALQSFAHRFVMCLASGKEFASDDGTVRFQPTEAGRAPLEASLKAEVNVLAAEQSNSLLTIGDIAMLKIYRRIVPGEHPEAEMERYLTEARFRHAPPLLGHVIRVASDGASFTLGTALGFVRNEGDAWSWILDRLSRALHMLAPATRADIPESDLLSDCEAIVAAIGKRLGELHTILSYETSDPAFAPKLADTSDIENWSRKAEERIQIAFEAISRVQIWERDQDRERARTLLSQSEAVIKAAHDLAKSGIGTLMTRIHGDFHLGHVLVADGDAYIIDFEGEPGASVAERRAKTSPLWDVASLLRSIDYAGATFIDRARVGAVPVDMAQRDELLAQFHARATTAFARAYWEATGSRNAAAVYNLISLFLIEKAAYEITYEAANRPTWIGVPIAGLTRVLARIRGGAA
jgi:maltose alpha-D-glucosyltransferase/alpha-amylase